MLAKNTVTDFPVSNRPGWALGEPAAAKNIKCAGDSDARYESKRFRGNKCRAVVSSSHAVAELAGRDLRGGP